MYYRSCWYIAALSHEVTRLAPLARTLLGEKIVLFRRKDGVAAALTDRCPHRFAPLSIGRLTEDGIACGYHGMQFNAQGICVANPTQPDEAIPKHARVKAYPLIERQGLLWIWMGKPEAADPATVPNYECYDHPDWSAETAHMQVAGNYLLLVDNLFDLSHINFVHGDILGSPDMITRMTSRTEKVARGMIECWFSGDAPAVPAWRAVVDAPWIEGHVDFWMDMHWEAASNMILDVGVTPAGRPRAEGSRLMGLDCITPETATSSHYFYGAAQPGGRASRASVDFWMKAQAYAFEQDKRMSEAVQANMGVEWDILAMNPVINKADRAALSARRTLRKLIAAES